MWTCAKCKCTQPGYPAGHRWCRILRENREPSSPCAFSTSHLGYVYATLHDELLRRGSIFPSRVIARAAVERSLDLMKALVQIARESADKQGLSGLQWAVVQEAEAAIRQADNRA